MMTNEANAAEKTTLRGCRIAMSAAIKNVLSPNSDIMIIVNENKKECSGADVNPDGESASEPSKSKIERSGESKPSESES